jgi:glycosyltransferase involved in cell wall biosynthesis
VTTTPTVSVVITARDQGEQLAVVLAEIPDEHEIVLVDGHSTDGTVAAARAVRPDLVLVYPTRVGRGHALARGFRAAGGDVVVVLSVDGSDDPAEIAGLVRALVDGADFARGSRLLAGGGREGSGRLRLLARRGRDLLARLALGVRGTDLGHSYVAFWRDLVPVLDLPDVAAPAPFDGSTLWGDGPEIDVLLTRRATRSGARVVDVPSVQRRVLDGAGGGDVRDAVLVLLTAVAERHRGWAGRRQDRALQRALHAPRPVLVQDLIAAA